MASRTIWKSIAARENERAKPAAKAVSRVVVVRAVDDRKKTNNLALSYRVSPNETL